MLKTKTAFDLYFTSNWKLGVGGTREVQNIDKNCRVSKNKDIINKSFL